jgi:cytochrome c nitrite reductase small subunit
MRNVLRFLVPPDEWTLPVIVVGGIFVGLGLHVLYISNAVSYLSDDPRTCVNCHVMNPQFATWRTGSHGRVATCNDCHVPQDHFVRTYLFKANDGLRHAFMFTFRLEPQVMRIKPAGERAVQENCIRCHADQIHPVSLRAISNRSVADQTDRFCWDCHRETPHGRVNSLASTPHARVPPLRPVVPEWIGRRMSAEGEGRGSP